MQVAYKLYDEYGRLIYNRYSLAKVIYTERIGGYRHLSHIRNLRREALLDTILKMWETRSKPIKRYQTFKQEL